MFSFWKLFRSQKFAILLNYRFDSEIFELREIPQLSNLICILLASGPNIVEEPLQKPPVPAEINPGIPNAVTNFPNGLHIPSHHPLLSINGLPPLNTPALLAEEEKACAHKPPLVEGTLDCPPHSDYPYHHQETADVSAHNEETEPIAPTGHPPTLPFEIPSHHKFEGRGHNVEPELLSIIESNNQQVTSLSHEVKNIESRLGNVESIVEVLEKAVYRIEEKVGKWCFFYFFLFRWFSVTFQSIGGRTQVFFSYHVFFYYLH